jgi:hypothetical protein
MRIQIRDTQFSSRAADRKIPCSRSLDTCNSSTLTDAVAARRIVRQAPGEFFSGRKYQNQNIHIPWPKPKRPLRKSSKKPPLKRL